MGIGWENVPILFSSLGITWGNVPFFFPILGITWVNIHSIYQKLGYKRKHSVFSNKNPFIGYKLLLLGHRSLIKNKTQTAEINMVNQRILYRLDVSYARQHTFSKVTVTIF